MNRKWILNLMVFSTIFTMAACSSDPVIKEETIPTATQPVETNTEPVVEKPAVSLEWSYAGNNGPNSWGDIRPEYQTCKTGKSQSPVNLKWSKPISDNPIKFSYGPSQAQIENTGYTYRLRFTASNTILFKGETYILEKLEVRSPTEHTLSGNSLPMELQLYHKTSSGLKTAILSLIVIEGKQAPWFDEIWAQAKNVQPGQTSTMFNVNPSVIIPPAKTHYHYVGSLTHPPCSEGVDWFIYNTPLQLSREQIAAFRSSYNDNNRKVQPLNDRKVTNH